MRTLGTTTLALKLHARQKKKNSCQVPSSVVSTMASGGTPAPLEGTPVRSETGHVPAAMQAGRCPRTPSRGAAAQERGPGAHFYAFALPHLPLPLSSRHFGLVTCLHGSHQTESYYVTQSMPG